MLWLEIICCHLKIQPQQMILKKPKDTKKQLEQDLKYLRKENAKLNKKILTLGTSMSMRTEQLKQEENRHVYHTEEFNTPLLDNEEYQCCITGD
ncbi:hypothetical protein QTP88_004741 [Uroleucon formosanum]